MSEIDLYSDVEGNSEASFDKLGSFDTNGTHQQRLNTFKGFLLNEYSFISESLLRDFISNIHNIYVHSNASYSDGNEEKFSRYMSNLYTHIQELFYQISANRSHVQEIQIQMYLSTIADLESTVQQMVNNNGKLQKDFDILQHQYDGMREAAQEVQDNMLAEFNTHRQQNKECLRKIKELEDELRLAHSIRHDTTIAHLALTNDLALAIQGKEASDKLASNIGENFRKLTKKYESLTSLYNQLKDECAAITANSEKLQITIQSLEKDLRGLDAAEAGRSHAIEMKYLAEQRGNKLEQELSILRQAYQNQKEKYEICEKELRNAKNEIISWKESADIFKRENTVLKAEIVAANSIISNLRLETTNYDQRVNDIQRVVNNRSHEIELLLKEREETEDVIKILRNQMEELQRERDITYSMNEHDIGSCSCNCCDHSSNSQTSSVHVQQLRKRIQELNELYDESEGKRQVCEDELSNSMQVQQDLYEEISRLTSEHDIMSQMNHNLQMQFVELQQKYMNMKDLNS